MRNFVAKHANEFCKPKTFRNRKKDEKAGKFKRDKPKHDPYVRRRKVYGTEEEDD